MHKCLLSITYKINYKTYKKKYIKICIYVKIVISLHRQNDRTSNNIKYINSMKALELKDLKAGNIYKETISDNKTYYLEILSEGYEGDCNLVYVNYQEGRLANFQVSIKVNTISTPIYFEDLRPCTQKEFKAALKTIKDSLTF